MHSCAIIIKPITMSVIDARELVGESLVDQGVADWYSTGNYRERTINDKQVASLFEFKTSFKYWIENIKPFATDDKFMSNDTWAFYIINDEFIEVSLIPYSFWEFHDTPDLRRELLNALIAAYIHTINKHIEKYALMEPNTHDVVLLDYHE